MTALVQFVGAALFCSLAFWSSVAHGQAPLSQTASAMGATAAPVAVPATPVAVPATYEELLKQALPAKDLSTLIEPLYAQCLEQDDLRRRQCEVTRGFLVEYLRDHIFVADADVPPDTTPYDAAAQQVDMEVPGCLACVAPPRVANEPRYLVTRPPQRMTNGRAQVVPIASHEIAISDRVHADRFVERVVPRLRIEHVFRVGAPFGDSNEMTPVGSSSSSPAAVAKGVLIISLGHRVYDRCTGEVVAALPKATSKVTIHPDPSCPKSSSDELSQGELRLAAARAALPERLTPHQIDLVLAPVQMRIHECFVEFGEPSGNAKVQLTIGEEGKLTHIRLPAPFDKADIGLCMRAQLRAASFPKFRGGPMTIDYAYQVN